MEEKLRSDHASGDAFFVDSFECVDAFLVMLGQCEDNVWSQVWERHSSLLISFTDDVDMECCGYEMQTEDERCLDEMIIRTVRLSDGVFDRRVTHVVTCASSDQSVLSLVRESSEIIRKCGAAGPVILSSADLDPVIVWMSLITMSRQMMRTGDVNLSHYTRYLASHALLLSSPTLYSHLHDMLAWALEHHQLDYCQPNIRYLSTLSSIYLISLFSRFI